MHIFLCRLVAAVLLSVLLPALLAKDAEAQPFTFEVIPHNLPALKVGGASLADVDRDGDLDVLINGRPKEESVFSDVYSYLGSMPAQQPTPIPFDIQRLPTGTWSTGHAWGDYNHDGWLDLALSGIESRIHPYARATVLYRGGSGGFSEVPVDGLPPLHSGAATWSDYDNDGDEDLLMTGVDAGEAHRTLLFRNDDGALQAVSTGLPGVAYGDASWADFDGDGDDDLLLTGARADGSYLTEIYRNGPNGFEATHSGLPALHFASTDCADFDGDGDVDLALNGGSLGNYFYDAQTYVYRNDGSGQWTSVPGNLKSTFRGDVLWADYDNDGDHDLLVTGSGGSGHIAVSEIYEYQDGAFQQKSLLTGAASSSFAGGDADGDGDVDVLLLGEPNSTILFTSYYRNTQRTVNTPPSAPTGLQTSIDGGAVTFSWEPSDDTLSTSSELTYALRIGTSPGGIDVMAPHADPQTGRRRLAQFGNTGYGTIHALQGLFDGTYYWSVQAVDPSYTGSAFSSEGTFTIVQSGQGTSIDTESEPVRFALDAPRPNPSSGPVSLSYHLPSALNVRISIYDVLGRQIKVIADGRRPAGSHQARWDGRSSEGTAVGAGVYFCRITTEDGRQRTRTLSIIR